MTAGKVRRLTGRYLTRLLTFIYFVAELTIQGDKRHDHLRDMEHHSTDTHAHRCEHRNLSDGEGEQRQGEGRRENRECFADIHRCATGSGDGIEAIEPCSRQSARENKLAFPSFISAWRIFLVVLWLLRSKRCMPPRECRNNREIYFFRCVESLPENFGWLYESKRPCSPLNYFC